MGGFDTKAARTRLAKLRERAGYHPRRHWRLNLTRLERLSEQIAALPTDRRLTLRQYRVWIDAIHRLQQRQDRLVQLVRKVMAHQRGLEHRIRRTGALSYAQHEQRLLQYLLAREGSAGKNFYASALIRLAFLSGKRTREQCAEWGRKGAASRWSKHREETECDSRSGTGGNRVADPADADFAGT
jgi:hypothetical protein